MQGSQSTQSLLTMFICSIYQKGIYALIYFRNIELETNNSINSFQVLGVCRLLMEGGMPGPNFPNPRPELCPRLRLQ